MAKHLTDKQRKRIIADRSEGMSIRQLAKKYKCSTTTIQRTLNSYPEMTQLVTQKKEENTRDMLEYMDAKKQDAMKFVDLAMQEMTTDKKLQRASVQALATSIGIIIDKFTATSQPKQEVHPMIEAIAKAMENNNEPKQ
jgi:hypothetical protein